MYRKYEHERLALWIEDNYLRFLSKKYNKIGANHMVRYIIRKPFIIIVKIDKYLVAHWESIEIFLLDEL